MKRNTTRLARAGKCGAPLPKAPQLCKLGSKPARPTMPNPVHKRCNISRRVSSALPWLWLRNAKEELVDIEHFIRDQEQLCVLLPAGHSTGFGLLQKRQGQVPFGPARLTPKQQ